MIDHLNFVQLLCLIVVVGLVVCWIIREIKD